jgi:ERCC4-related helicase
MDLDDFLQMAIDLLSIDPYSIIDEDNLAIQEFHSVSASELSICIKKLMRLSDLIKLANNKQILETQGISVGLIALIHSL